MFKLHRLWLLGFLAVVLAAPQLFAQTTTASVNGTVTDAGGAIVPNASVTITNTSTGITTTATTNGKGFYNFPQLASGGPYTVDVNASGFKKFETTGLTLNPLDNRLIDVKLEIGTSSQTVEVTASSSAVETTDTELKDTISASEIEALPLFGRDATGLQKLQAGSVESSDRFGTYSANGSQTAGNSYVLDGIDLNDGPLQSEGLSINPDAIGQLTLITSTINPEFSRNSGEIINETLKSGTNNYHGDVFEFYRDTFLNNGNYFSQPGSKPPIHQNLYGGTLGGPLVKDKLFGFLAYQGYRNKSGSTTNTIVPTAAERSGMFPDGVTIPSSTFDPLAVKLLNQFVPLPTPGVLVGGFPAYNFNTADTGAGDQGIVRLDYHLSQKDAIFGSSVFASDPTTETLPFGGANLPGFGEIDAAHFKLYSADYTHTFSPNLLNDFALNYYRFNFAAVEPQTPVNPQSYGFNINPQTASSGLPVIGVGSFFTLGFSDDGPQPRKDTNLRAADTFTWIKGNHTYKFGGSVEQFRVSNPFYFDNAGSYNFYSFDSDYQMDVYTGLQNFLQGNADFYAQSSGGFIDALAYEDYFYAQDSWKVSPDLVFNYGLAYDIETPNKDTQFKGENIGCFSISSATTTIFPGTDPPPGLLYPGDPGCNNYGGTTVRKDHFAPRLGIDWSPSAGPSMLLGRAGAHDFSIRAGFGVYYNRDQEEGSLQNLETPPFNQTLEGTPASFADPLGSGANPFPYPIPHVGQTINWANFGDLDINAVAKNYSVPYVYNFNLNVQRELPSNIRLTVGYVGSVGHRLVITYEGDPITSAGHAACLANPACADPGQLATHVNFPQYTSQPALNPQNGAAWYASVGTQGTEGASNYNSAQVSIIKAPTHGLSFTVAYTYSKALDNSSGLESAGFNGRGFNQYPGYQLLNYGPSDYDARHNLHTSYIYQVPLTHSSNFLERQALSGWEITGYTALQSGNPVNITDGGVFLSKWCDEYSYYSCPDVPNVSTTSIPKLNPRSSSHQYFNTSPFSQEAVGTFGNTQRGIISGPGWNYTNLSLSKNFPLSSDGVRTVQLRMDVANAFNHANFANPDGNFTDGTFGAISSVKSTADINGDPAGGREIQLVGKFYF